MRWVEGPLGLFSFIPSLVFATGLCTLRTHRSRNIFEFSLYSHMSARPRIPVPQLSPPSAGTPVLCAVLLLLVALALHRRAWGLLCLAALAAAGSGVRLVGRLGPSGRWELVLVRHGAAIPAASPVHGGLAGGAARDYRGLPHRA